MTMKNAVCMHEEDYGILWKHYEFRNGLFEVRRSRRLVISFFATVGNYDYGFYWYLYQDGTIQLEAKLTGIIQTAAVMPGEKYAWGGMVDDNLGGPTHQHFFNVRMHMDLDGGGNTVTEHEFAQRPWGTDNPYGNAFDLKSKTLSRERDAAAIADGAKRALLEGHQSEQQEQRRQSRRLQARSVDAEPGDAGAGRQLRAQARRLRHQACLGHAL